MSAEIRKAAALMRERADVYTSSPWSAWLSDDRRWNLVGDRLDVENGVAARCADDDEAEHIASWHPAVALAVADWLAYMADFREEVDATGGAGHPIYGEEQALAVARAFLGGDE